MRFWLYAFVLSAFVLPAARAQFPVTPWVVWTPATVSAHVYNPYYETICCEGLVSGTTFNGLTRTSPFTFLVPPGHTRVATLGTNPHFNPFAGGWAQAFCRFQRW